MQGSMVEISRYRATSEGRNFIDQIKAPVFLKAVLGIKIIYEPQFNLEDKDNPSIKQDCFSSGQTHLSSHH